MNDSGISASLAANPEIAALLVLIIGVVIARLVRGATGLLLGALNQWLARYSTTEGELVSEEFQRFSKGLVFWLLVLATVVLALRLLGIDGLENALGALFRLIPQLIIAFAIIGVGHLVGLLLRGVMARLGEDIEPDSLGPRLVHGAVLLVAIVMGLQQLRIDISFVTQLVLVLVVVIMGCMAVAFALGARDYTANLVGRSELQRYATGDRIRIGAYEGTIVNIHRTGLELLTAEGIVAIPAAWFSREPVTQLTGEE